MKKIIWLMAVIAIGCNRQMPVKQLGAWLAAPIGAISDQPFAQAALTKEEAAQAADSLLSYYQQRLLQEKGDQWDNRLLKSGTLEMPFFYQVWGDEPAGGHSLFISLHGGGSVPAEFNDGQYKNQKHLYDSVMATIEGVYLAPRAAVNEWNMWHQAHVDPFLTDLIRLAILKEGVNPDKVYLLGYSAGGDGVYQLAPRMAPYLAAASMMAGHPDNASALSLRDLPYAMHVGALDSSFNRNKLLLKWGKELDSLQTSDPEGYVHQVQSHEGRAHWMYKEDAVALPWMAGFVRNENPDKVVWIQDDVLQNSFYWLQVPAAEAAKGKLIRADYNSGKVNVTTSDYDHVLVGLNDAMISLDEPVTVLLNGNVVFEGTVNRNIATLSENLAATVDQARAYTAVIEIDCKAMKAIQKKY